MAVFCFLMTVHPFFSNTNSHGTPVRYPLPLAATAAFVVLNTAIAFGIFGWRLALAGVRLTDDGVVVRNARRSIPIPWAELQGFEVGRRPGVPLMGVARRMDGSGVLCFGVQRLLATGYEVTRSVHDLIAGLNARVVAEHARLGVEAPAPVDPQVGDRPGWAVTDPVRHTVSSPEEAMRVLRRVRLARLTPTICLGVSLAVLPVALVAGMSTTDALTTATVAAGIVGGGMFLALHLARRRDRSGAT